MSDLAFYCFQYALALLLAPLLPGIIARIKAKVAGRHGKPVLQLYFDIFKGLRKGEVISQVTTPVFTLGPVVGLATVLCALALLPLGGMASPLRIHQGVCGADHRRLPAGPGPLFDHAGRPGYRFVL